MESIGSWANPTLVTTKFSQSSSSLSVTAAAITNIQYFQNKEQFTNYFMYVKPFAFLCLPSVARWGMWEYYDTRPLTGVEQPELDVSITLPFNETCSWAILSWTGLGHYASLRHDNSRNWNMEEKKRILYINVVFLSFSRDKGDSVCTQGWWRNHMG